MHSLEIINKMNTLKAAAKSRRVARAMNNPRGHAKDAEKGRVIPKKIGGIDKHKFARISSVAH